MLNPGTIAPDFSLLGDDSQVHSLKDFAEGELVIFFYPKDLTPGCTTEACDFSDSLGEFQAMSAQVVGISQDSLASHARFKSKHTLRMLLLSDPDLAVHKLYGAYGEKHMYGKTTLGVIRSTFLIDKTGKIIRSWYKVRVKNHAHAVLETLKKWRSKT